MSTIFKSIDARPMPGSRSGPLAWLRVNLFFSAGSSLLSLGLLALGVWVLVASMDWAVLHAVFNANLQSCNELRGVGDQKDRRTRRAHGLEPPEAFLLKLGITDRNRLIDDENVGPVDDDLLAPLRPPD